MATVAEIEFDELKQGLSEGKYVVLDVRDVPEVQGGRIPKSVNIPLGQIIEIFRDLTDDEFQDKYGISKTAENLVFSCRSGRRAAAAIESLQKDNTSVDFSGITHRLYKGSYSDWESKGGEIEK